MRLYVPVNVSLEKAAAGEFIPDKPVVGYANYDEAINNLKPKYQAHDLPGVKNGNVGIAGASMLYQVDAKDWSHAEPRPFEGPRYEGTLNPKDITGVECVYPADFLNQEARATAPEHVFEGNVPQNYEAQQVAQARLAGWEQCIACVQESAPATCAQVDARDPLDARALSDAYSPTGYVNVRSDDPQTQYVQSYLKLMIHEGKIDTVAKCDKFTETYNKNLEAIAAANPNLSPMMAAEKAMDATIKEFQAEADKTHNLHEQRALGEMATVHSELSALHKMAPEGDRALLTATYINNVVNSEGPRDAELTRTDTCEQMRAATGNNLYDQIKDSNVNPEAWGDDGHVIPENPDGPDKTYYGGEDLDELSKWETEL